MQLERIAKRRTLADGYLANERLKPGLKGLLWFYALHGFFVAMSFVYTALSAPPADSAVGRLILSFQATTAITVLVGTAILVALYALLIIAVRLAAAADSPTTSLLISILSLLIHALTLVAMGLVTVTWILGIAELSGQPNAGIGASLLNGITVLAIIALVDLVVWLMLMVSTVGRSYRSLAAALRRVPGRYEYSYGTTVMSSTQRLSEVSFMEQALRSAPGYTEDDAEGILLEDGDRYLVRFLHRSGKVVAASLQDRSTRRLMAIFPGRESRTLNVSILLEDSYIIQRERASEAQGTLKADSLIAEAAEASGWIVSSDGDSLLSLRRA